MRLLRKYLIEYLKKLPLTDLENWITTVCDMNLVRKNERKSTMNLYSLSVYIIIIIFFNIVLLFFISVSFLIFMT